MTEEEIDKLLMLCEQLRGEAGAELFALSLQRNSASFILEEIAKEKVAQSNLLRKALIQLGCRAPGPEWEIVGYKLEPVPGT